MNYGATITVDGDADNIIKLFESEDKKFKHNRSKYDVKKVKGKAVFEVAAQDATALRSTMESVAKGLKVYEDMKGI